jgi:hypothetical protein
MREIFSNNAIGYLTKSLGLNDGAVFVNTDSNFPDPIPGQEFFKLVLVGSCSDNIEIVTIIENCGNCLKIGSRGAEGTTKSTFAAQDLAYNTLTAEIAQKITDGWSFYLGAHCPAPMGKIADGSFYYDTCQERILFWNGTNWIATYQLAPTVSGQYTYIFDSPQPDNLTLPRTDVYGNLLPVLSSTKHLPEVFLNGVRLTQQITSSIFLGDYAVQWNTTNIKLLDGFTATPTDNAVVVVMLHKQSGQDSLPYGTAYSNEYSNSYN